MEKDALLPRFAAALRTCLSDQSWRGFIGFGQLEA
jgi:hypothetical protein